MRALNLISLSAVFRGNLGVDFAAFLKLIDARHDHDLARHQPHGDFRVVAFRGADA